MGAYINFNTFKGDNIKIALIDSGINTNNDNIKNNIIEGCMLFIDKKDYTIKSMNYLEDKCFHGTCCAEEITCIAPNSKIIPIKIFDSVLKTNSYMLTEAIKTAIDYEVDIINISAGTTCEINRSKILEVCREAYRKNIVIVSSEANNNKKTYPAYFDIVIGVRGVSYLRDIYSYEVLDDEKINILSLNTRNTASSLVKGYTIQGSSFATAHITGIISIVIQQYKIRGILEILSVLREAQHS